jgi:hypothetical protein
VHEPRQPKPFVVKRRVESRTWSRPAVIGRTSPPVAATED